MKILQLNPEEKIIFKVRKHWLTITVSGLGFLGLAVVPLIIDSTVGFNLSFLPITMDATAVSHLGVFFYLLWLLAMWVGFFSAWTDYYLDVWQVTDRRIIDIEQKGFFSRDEATIRFENIQDITIDTRGFFATIFNYGDIRIQSAGAGREFILHHATDPADAKKKIEALHDRVVGGTTPKA